MISARRGPLFAVGVLLIVAAAILVSVPTSDSKKSETVASTATYWRPPMGLAGELQVHTMAAKLEYPSNVRINDSFLVALKVSVVNSQAHVGVIDRNDPLPAAEPPAKPADLSKLFFRLEMQGIDASPKQASSVSRDGVVHWSARATTSGNFKGVIVFDAPAAKAKEANEPEDFESLPLERFQFERPVEVSILASDPYFVPSKVGGYVLAFLGSLATLPGLLAFWKSQSPKDAESKAKSA